VGCGTAEVFLSSGPQSTKKGCTSAALFVKLPGIETDALPGILGFELPVRSISVQLSTARYLRFRFRVLTASRLDHRGSEPCTRRLRRLQGRLNIGQPGANPVGNYHDSHPDDNAATWRRQRVVQDAITNGAWAPSQPEHRHCRPFHISWLVLTAVIAARRVARPPGSSAVEGTTATQSAPASW
jgi:hypothetical protein